MFQKVIVKCYVIEKLA